MLIGLRGLASLAPLFVAALLALSLGASGEDERPARWIEHTASAVLIAALVLLPLCLYGRRPSGAEDQATAIVRSVWEPPPVVRR